MPRHGVFLMTNFKGWILDAIPRESAAAVNQKVSYSYIPARRRELVTAKSLRSYFAPSLSENNLFMHHRTFLFVKDRSNLRLSKNRVWLTHFDNFSDIGELFNSIELIDKIFVQNSNLATTLSVAGFPRNKIAVQPGAVSRHLFSPLKAPQVQEDYFLFTGDCKSRKNPSYVLWLIENFPNVKFVIHGNGWKDYEQGILLTFSNLMIYDFDFGLQPGLLRCARGLIIVSTNEGGPIALLESLACGTPVISTATGFAQDVLNPRRGVVIPNQSSISEWRNFFDMANRLKDESRHSDLLDGQFTWESLGKELYE